MNAEFTIQELLEVQAHFGLPSPALVEKDFYVSKALAAISRADIAPFRLVLGGGTALCRAYRLIERMSEDIDLKIVSEADPLRSNLRQLRQNVTDALLAAGFLFDPNNVAYRQSRNESRYTVFRAPYATLQKRVGVLRPEIQIEMTLSPLYRAPVILPLRSFVAEAYDRSAEVSRMVCVSIAQTIAEKFVALTRRTAAEIVQADSTRDSTLVRHLYDMHVTRSHYDIADVAQLAKPIMSDDAAVFSKQFPAYRDHPLAMIRLAVGALGDDLSYANLYDIFQRDMIYGEKIDYAACLATLNAIADRLY